MFLVIYYYTNKCLMLVIHLLHYIRGGLELDFLALPFITPFDQKWSIYILFTTQVLIIGYVFVDILG